MKLKLNLKVAIKIIYLILKFLCLIPYSLNLKTLETKCSIKSILWCIIFSSTLIIVDPYLDEMVFKTYDLSVNDTGIAQQIFNKVSRSMALFWVYCSIFNLKFIFKIIKLFKTIFKKLSKYDVDYNETAIIWKKLIIQFLTIQISIITNHYVYSIYICNGSTPLILFYTLITTVKYMFGSAILIKFNVFLILLKIGFDWIIGKLNLMECEFSDTRTIDELAEIYFKLCEVSLLVIKMFSIPLLSILLYLFIVIENQLFNIFVSFAMETRNGMLGIICIFGYSFVKVGELVIVLQDINLVVQKVNI